MTVIPKIIHCCWLSGDPLPFLYQQCVDSWKEHMPDYEIMLWDMERAPKDVLFVRQAIEVKKWAYAADYIRLYALYHYGGVYLDMDVMVYRSFDPFLGHRAFSSVEFNPRIFYESFPKGGTFGIGIEAAVIGSEKFHPWIKDIMDFYQGRRFVNDPKYYWEIIMPRVMKRISAEKYGFQYFPVYQVLRDDIHLYPPDVFSGCNVDGVDVITVMSATNQIRYSYHICAHSWWEGGDYKSLSYKIKKITISIIGKKSIAGLKRLFRKKAIIEKLK